MTTYTVNVGSVCGSSFNVVLTVSSPPSGVTWSFDPNPGNISCFSGDTSCFDRRERDFISTLTVQTARDLPVGAYTLNIVGSDVGVTHTQTVALSVTSSRVHEREPHGDFTLSVDPDPLIMSFCDPPKIVTVTIQSIGRFDSSVTFTANSPNGMSVVFLPNPVTPPMTGTAMSQATITISNSLSAGNYVLTITGTSTTPPFIQRSATVTVQLTGCIPGFPFESILAGIVVGVLALAIIRRRKPSHLIPLVKKLN
jgi:hypothetical protein